MFSRWKRKKRDGLETQAETLVTAAKIQATVAYTSVGDRYDLVYSIPTETWDVLVTVAGVFVAATRVGQIGLPEARLDSLLAIVARELQAWHPEGMATFEDCTAFFAQRVDRIEKDPSPAYLQQPELFVARAIGLWIVEKLVEHAPESEQEWALASALGLLVTHWFDGWWSDV